ncbi:MAG TPA: PEP-utilizing enzyme [Candidatus Dormibacteraeota bacterium]|nr:PEP-utilizing enzyme [Candidatus Dormibacteraeota bacterium]
MVWEPDTIEPPSMGAQPITEVAPGFPVEFDTPAHVKLEWGGDRGHFPEALSPLAGDYARVVGSTLNGWQSDYDGFPQRWHTGVWHGWVYYAFEPNATPEEWPEIRRRTIELWRTLANVTDAMWQDDILPEVQSLCARIAAVDAEATDVAVLADAWESSWLAAERAWKLHVMTAGQIQALDDLADAYRVAVPDAPANEAFRLLLGDRHVLFEMELETERLAAMAAATPAVAAALRTGVRSLDVIRASADGEAFALAIEAFLERHGHLGQSSDDLSVPSWDQAPDRIIDELTKRLETPAPPAAERQARLLLEGEGLAAAARQRLADRPEALARFDGALELNRRIGLLSEVHNYWIDRLVQARMHSLAMRVGRRLVRERAIDATDDVFYLRRTEVADLLRAPRDVRGLVSDRRSLHARQRRIAPAPIVGTPEAAPGAQEEESHPAPSEVGALRGTGASPGVVRGTARVVHDADEFGRIVPGDIIICPSSNPSWVPIFAIAGGLVAIRGGLLSHAAVVAREFGLPAVVGVRDAMQTIRDGQQVEIDGTSGAVRLL